MSEGSKFSRRSLLKLGAAALAAIPVVALAAKNDSMRAALKYKDTPEGDKSCANCALFQPGKTPKDLGQCSALPGDTEVSPNAWCAAWVKKA